MPVSDILQSLKGASGSNAKKHLLQGHSENELLKRILKYATDPYLVFNVVKVPKVSSRLEFPLSDESAWHEFFTILDECSSRAITGNAAIERIHVCFSSVHRHTEPWMRKVLKKHLAIGASSKTINSVFPGLIPTFDVQLAQKFEFKRVKDQKMIALEPKLDGIRCCAVVEKGKATLYARSGKQIVNFDNTIGQELILLGDGFYDGEIMGEDFVALMRQAYRKENVNVQGSYLSLFDYLPLEDWKSKGTSISCHLRRQVLECKYSDANASSGFQHITVVPRVIIPASEDEINSLHHSYVAEGYEGVMVKNLDSPYRFGRGHEVMKVKSFFDIDLEIIRVEEGTGKFAGMCGSLVVNNNGTEVGVGSGLNDDLRKKIWSAPNEYIGRIVEVRYQEMTPDGSLRFPTFVHFRNDR